MVEIAGHEVLEHDALRTRPLQGGSAFVRLVRRAHHPSSSTLRKPVSALVGGPLECLEQHRHPVPQLGLRLGDENPGHGGIDDRVGVAADRLACGAHASERLGRVLVAPQLSGNNTSASRAGPLVAGPAVIDLSDPYFADVANGGGLPDEDLFRIDATGGAPQVTSAANAIDVYALITRDGGATWFGFPGGQDFS